MWTKFASWISQGLSTGWYFSAIGWAHNVAVTVCSCQWTSECLTLISVSWEKAAAWVSSTTINLVYSAPLWRDFLVFLAALSVFVARVWRVSKERHVWRCHLCDCVLCVKITQSLFHLFSFYIRTTGTALEEETMQIGTSPCSLHVLSDRKTDWLAIILINYKSYFY